MSKFIINGGRPLVGTVSAQGSKNSAVAVLIASIITDGISELVGVPDITDVRVCLELLECLGIRTEFSNGRVMIDTGGVRKNDVPSETVKKMRASSYLIGAELARFGECTLPDSGGCNFGSRPVNYHVGAMCSLGAVCNGDTLSCGKLIGSAVTLPYPSVGATVNTIIAASKAEGVTVIQNAAREPHIVDLASYLNSCGAEIYGAGTNCIKINGKPRLHGGKLCVCPDMIETGTYLIYGLMTKGCVTVENTVPSQLDALFDALQKMGASLKIKGSSVSALSKCLKSTDISTDPYPGFPTDLQPQISALLGISCGVGHVTENVFRERFGYIRSLEPFGFCSFVKNRTVEIKGGAYCSARSRATDLRGGAAAVGAALSCFGTSFTENAELILRGYSDFINKLCSLGADIAYICE